MENQAYALVRALKSFKVYILYSNIIAYFSNNSIKEILMQRGNDGKRKRWIAKILEYDLDIKPTNFMKGKGLGKLLNESNCKALRINVILNIQHLMMKYQRKKWIYRYMKIFYYPLGTKI